jgi:hypothetical protein
MLKRIASCLILWFCYSGGLASGPRVVISSDFPPLDVIPGSLGRGAPEKRSDPDDVQSMVRFLLYANEFEIAGLIAASATLANIANKGNLLDIIDVYGQVADNLRRHDPAYPTADALRAVTREGLSGTYGRPWEEIIGEGKDSEASTHIIDLLEGPDSRPIWFCFWGGSQELAQALWCLRQVHGSSQLMVDIIAKIRVFMIARQDGSAQWLIDHFPGMHIILSEESFKAFFFNAVGSDRSMGDIAWTDEHVRFGHGPLGAVYPKSGWVHTEEGVIEGDSPSFLYLVSGVMGLSDSEKPDHGGWGGRFEQAGPGSKLWTDAPEGTASVTRWQHARQNDFAARMDRCVHAPGKVNRNPVAVLQGDHSGDILYLNAQAGRDLVLDATGSLDPDSGAIEFNWLYYKEAGNYPGDVQMTAVRGLKTSVRIPADAAGTDIHIVLEVQDSGEPVLSGYRRAVITVGD